MVERRQGALSEEDLRFLNFRSGYTSFTRCLPSQTVDGCVAYLNNGVYSAATDGLFSYGGGHMEKHASLNGLGALNNASLAAEIRAQLDNLAVASLHSLTILERPGKVDVVVFPPIAVDDWTLDNLSERIAEVRQLYLDTLRKWPHDKVPDNALYHRTAPAAQPDSGDDSGETPRSAKGRR